MGESPRRPAIQRVELKRKRLDRYRAPAGEETIDAIRELAHDLRGLRVLEISSTATGGGVAEMLSSLVPLERDLGLDAAWGVVAGDPAFFEVTKKLHNGMQGLAVELSPEERRDYLRHNERYAAALEDAWDVVIVHDPQPAALRSFAPGHRGRWIWRCHVDSSTPHLPTWEFLRPHVERHDHAVFTLREFVPPDLSLPTTLLVPAIDPLSSKNRALPGYLARETVAELGVDLERPLLLQVSRFDRWKDPLGVIDVWRRARETLPTLQLALVGSMATDDPEGWQVYDQIARETVSENACFLLTDQMGVTSHEVNALQRVADVAIQKSVREGFGLIVSETQWKGTALVAGHAGGIPLQLEDGVTGRFASTIGEFAACVVELLEDPATAHAMGTAGIQRVRERFLLPRLLHDQLALLREVAR
ncbi:MAG TPA: glycosyltransferase [Conexibacter sp.]|nr:glycosyltransferase [Conexibacter sp.]